MSVPDASVVIVAPTSQVNVRHVSSQPSGDHEFVEVGFDRLILEGGGIADDLGLRRVFGSSETPSRLSWCSDPSPRRHHPPGGWCVLQHGGDGGCPRSILGVTIGWRLRPINGHCCRATHSSLTLTPRCPAPRVVVYDGPGDEGFRHGPFYSRDHYARPTAGPLDFVLRRGARVLCPSIANVWRHGLADGVVALAAAARVCRLIASSEVSFGRRDLR